MGFRPQLLHVARRPLEIALRPFFPLSRLALGRLVLVRQTYVTEHAHSTSVLCVALRGRDLSYLQGYAPGITLAFGGSTRIPCVALSSSGAYSLTTLSGSWRVAFVEQRWSPTLRAAVASAAGNRE